MKHIRITLMFALFALFLPTKASPAFDIPVKVFKAIEVGDVEALSSHFSQSVELIMFEQEGIYSKQQANQILKDFFNKNRPSKFTILHQGGSGASQYAIGKLETSNGNFRVHFHVKMDNDTPLIHQLRIQNE